MTIWKLGSKFRSNHWKEWDSLDPEERASIEYKYEQRDNYEANTRHRKELKDD